MSYSDFTINSLKEKFKLNFIYDVCLFAEIVEYKIPDYLKLLLERYVSLALAIDTEKARSEYIVAPILGELKWNYKNKISLFSGSVFNVDEKLGLTGVCDYLISQTPEQYTITAPIIVIVEAKNDNIKSGVPQCVAEMFAAQVFNKKQNNSIKNIYGVVSTGTNWKFLKLSENTLYVDVVEYYIDAPEKILGILSSIASH
ncbi:MAG: hypothetical protein J0M03_10475 [Acidobacteria bacterium]|nr:hypothetical protein [Acidobacteriota bacterium]